MKFAAAMVLMFVSVAQAQNVFTIIPRENSVLQPQKAYLSNSIGSAMEATNYINLGGVVISR